MRVEQSHHIDASEPDSNGKHRFRYEYDIFQFTDGERVLVARSYTDTSSEAHFLRIEVPGKDDESPADHLNDPLLKEAARHLRSLGKTDLRYLGYEGYLQLPPET